MNKKSSPVTKVLSREITLLPPGKRSLGWLTFGIGIKRWAVLAIWGLILAALGASLSLAYVSVDFSLWVMETITGFTHTIVDSVTLGVACLLAGVICVAIGLRGTFKAVERVYANSNSRSGDFLETALRQREMEKGERVVAIGGGTGLSTMLRGLKAYSSNITAVVTMADDGGSSGKLREEGMLPPGDLRNCIAALADTEPLMEELFQYRFRGLGPLQGHSLGNLIMAAFSEMRGDFASAVKEAAKVLAIRGQVLPSTLDEVRLGAKCVDGTCVEGQSKINQTQNIDHVYLMPEKPRALPAVIEAIQDAEIIIIGPGSLFTSILPNLLVPEIAAAIKDSTAPKIYVCNVMTQPHETDDFKASDHLRAIKRHAGSDLVTHVLVNTGRIPEETQERYAQTGAQMVEADVDALRMLGVRPLKGNFIDVTNVVRHNPRKLASVIFRLASKLG
jgi:uncharacterized cofD-like protein